jgi:RimJ/RimL family protein N-acetyltransferase
MGPTISDRFKMNKVELVALGIEGAPIKDIGELSKAAKDACGATVAHYKRAGFCPPWISYLALHGSKVVGICAFTAAPVNARVEIAYNTFPAFEGKGVATAMTTQLLAMARTTQPDIEVCARTLPAPNASNAILRKLGFAFTGAVNDMEEGQVWEWRLPPSAAL